MQLRRTSLLIAIVLLAIGSSLGPAAAQGFTPMPSQGFGPPPGAARPPGPNPFDVPPQQQAEPPCFKEFLAHRAETEKRGKAVQAAGQRKATPAEACKLFNSLISAEVKFIKFVDDNLQTCGIPPQVPGQLKDNHTKVKQVRDRVCQIATQQPSRPAGPSLSDALGTTRLPDSSNIKTGRGGGTFDTLTNTTPAR